ncbi:SET and MYND domain-containing protein 4, partial [Caligus rogercresseyi]
LKERRKDCLVKETVELQEAGAPKIKSKLSIVYGGTSVGRFVSASEAINTGESILSESPVGSVLYPEQRGSHCAVCFLRLIAGYPCPTCSNIAFCSPSCREKGSFHEFECRYDDFLRGLGLSSIGRLALRLITSQPLEYFLKIKEHLKASNETEESLSQHGYINIYNLTGNGDQRWREDRVHRSYLSAILTKVLLCSGYFKSTQSVKEDTRYICELLCRYMEILQFNAHEVYEFIRKDKRALKPSKQAPIGLAIYQKASYFNHSCFGSIVRYFEGNIMHLRALHPIEVGEEVYENYGPTFYFKGTSERQRDLRHRYWFDCRCGPCTHKWPLLKSLPSSEKISSFYHNELNQESFKDLSAFIEKHFRPSSGGGLPSEILVRAMDKLRTFASSPRCPFALSQFLRLSRNNLRRLSGDGLELCVEEILLKLPENESLHLRKPIESSPAAGLDLCKDLGRHNASDGEECQEQRQGPHPLEPRVEIILDYLSKFKKRSGLTVNREKTSILSLGLWNLTEGLILRSCQIKEKVEILGIVWCRNGVDKKNWPNINFNVSHLVTNWRAFNLQKRIDLYNTRVIPAIIYRASSSHFLAEKWLQSLFHRRYLLAVKRNKRQIGGGLVFKWFFMGSDLTNRITSKLSPVWGSTQRIIWHYIPKFKDDLILDVIRRNADRKYFFNGLGNPHDLEESAIKNGIFTRPDIKPGSQFDVGRFKFPLLRSSKEHTLLTPWHLKMNVQSDSNMADRTCQKKFDVLDLLERWRKNILRSLAKIADGKKFTAQQQDCGTLYNSILHAFVDCRAASILKRFMELNLIRKINRQVIGGRSSTTKTINFGIFNAKALIAKRITMNEPLHPWRLKAVLLSAAARYAALDLKIPTLFNNSFTTSLHNPHGYGGLGVLDFSSMWRNMNSRWFTRNDKTISNLPKRRLKKDLHKGYFQILRESSLMCPLVKKMSEAATPLIAKFEEYLGWKMPVMDAISSLTRGYMMGHIDPNRQVPKEFREVKSKKLFSSDCAFTEDGIILVIYKAKKNRNVIMLSSQHNNHIIPNDLKRKLEVLLYYNKTKGGVDCVDERVATYSVKYSSRRWHSTKMSCIHGLRQDFSTFQGLSCLEEMEFENSLLGKMLFHRIKHIQDQQSLKNRPVTPFRIIFSNATLSPFLNYLSRREIVRVIKLCIKAFKNPLLTSAEKWLKYRLGNTSVVEKENTVISAERNPKLRDTFYGLVETSQVL